MVNIPSSNRDRARSIANAGQLAGRTAGAIIGMAATAPVEGAALAAAGRIAARGVAAARAARAANAARSSSNAARGSLREPLLSQGNRAAQTVRRNTSAAAHSNRIISEAASSVHQTIRHVARQMAALGVSTASRSIGRVAARGVSRVLPAGVHSTNIARAVGEGVTELAAKTGRSLTHAVGAVYGRGIRSAEKYFRGGAQDGYHSLAREARASLEGSLNEPLLLEEKFATDAEVKAAIRRAKRNNNATSRALRENLAANRPATERMMGTRADRAANRNNPIVNQEQQQGRIRSVWEILLYGE